jgi:pyruvate kinase
VRGPKIFTVVEQGGPLSNNKGINRKGGGLTAPALTEKDKQDIKLAAELKADFLAVSFPRSGDDVRWARDLFTKAGGHGLIVSKIERAEAIPALEEILDASDAIMVARGDLAVEVGDAAVPALQKRMIRMAREKQKLTITATQMMESMISSPIPTRAEVSDVANAVLDGTDAVMTSAETAAGKYPAETIAAMVRVCVEVEKEDSLLQERRGGPGLIDVENSVARATAFTAAGLPIKAIAALTQSGRTALLMSRMAISVPIYAMSSVIETRRRVTLFRGVHPVRFKGARNPEKALQMAEDELIHRGVVQNGDLIVLTIGEPFGRAGGTNTMKIVKVGEHRKK